MGSYSRNKKVGEGKMYFPDGSVYSGEWNEDKKNGVGEESNHLLLFTKS